MKTLQKTCDKKEYNIITGIHKTKDTQKIILITGQLLEKKRTIVVIAKELSMEARRVNIQL